MTTDFGWTWAVGLEASWSSWSQASAVARAAVVAVRTDKMVGMVIERRVDWILIDLEIALLLGAVTLHAEGGGISSLQNCARRLSKRCVLLLYYTNDVSSDVCMNE